MSHWRLFYHLVWATQDRHPYFAEPAAVQVIEDAIAAHCHSYQVIIHALFVMPDHVHIACSIPPRWAIAKVVQELKGSSSNHLNKAVFSGTGDAFAWQAEYGINSLSERGLPDVTAYVQNQPIRHAENNLWPGLERVERDWPGARRTEVT